MAGIYLHIPFCRQACYYCDFHFSTNHNVKEEMVGSLMSEILLQKDFLNGEEIKSIYFGGGTPSLLSSAELNKLLGTIYHNHSVASNVEITLEANPDDLTKNNLEVFKDAGINRLSIGIQSFQNDVLKFLNRAHDSTTAVSAYRAARDAGFTNLSIDLMFAIPGLENNQLEQDIESAISLEPEHISCYSLTIEERTTFGRWRAAGKMEPMDDELAALQLELLIDSLEQGGYEHYEISNFSKPGFYSRHNSSYWKQEKYLGIGPSAHSYNKDARQFNISNNHLYIKNIQKGIVPAEIEVLTPGNKINEYLLTTLRTRWGADLAFIKTHHHHDILKKNGKYIQQLQNNNLIDLRDDILTLTKKGKLLADKIASDLFV